MGKYVNEVYFNEEERTDREMLEMYQSLKFDELFRKRANDRVLETLGKIRNRIEFITILLDNMNDKGRKLIMDKLLSEEDMIDSFQECLSECMS